MAGLFFSVGNYLFYAWDNHRHAKWFFQQAIKRGHPQAITALALLYHQEKNMELAEPLYLRAVEEGGGGENNHVVLGNLGTLYYVKGDHEKAELWWGKAVEKGNYEVARALIRHLYKLGRWNDVLRWIVVAANINREQALEDFREMALVANREAKPRVPLKQVYQDMFSDDCSICLEKLRDCPPLLVLECGHVFHEKCVRRIKDEKCAYCS
jgi:tetratricopeptide (TPR) repeat protein